MQTFFALFLLTVLTADTGLRTITLELPDGWREVKPQQLEAQRPALADQNELQRDLREATRGKVAPILAMKRNTAEAMSASVQVFANSLPAELRGASSLEAARVIAFAGFATYGSGKYEIAPREITVGGLPGAEWEMRYKLHDQAGSEHAMVARTVLVADGPKLYLIGYSGPATAAAELEAFNGVVKSIEFSKRAGSRQP
jgi:hypothetical protein